MTAKFVPRRKSQAPSCKHNLRELSEKKTTKRVNFFNQYFVFSPRCCCGHTPIRPRSQTISSEREFFKQTDVVYLKLLQLVYGGGKDSKSDA